MVLSLQQILLRSASPSEGEGAEQLFMVLEFSLLSMDGTRRQWRWELVDFYRLFLTLLGHQGESSEDEGEDEGVGELTPSQRVLASLVFHVQQHADHVCVLVIALPQIVLAGLTFDADDLVLGSGNGSAGWLLSRDLFTPGDATTQPSYVANILGDLTDKSSAGFQVTFND